jgi:hypothetical protein
VAGWESLYEIALENRWFEDPNKTPYESVFDADFEELIYKLSMHNLMNA